MSYHDRMYAPDPPLVTKDTIGYARGRLTAGWDAPDMTDYTADQFERRLEAIGEKINTARLDFRKQVHRFNARCQELHVWREETEGMLELLMTRMGDDEQAQVEYSWRGP